MSDVSLSPLSPPHGNNISPISDPGSPSEDKFQIPQAQQQEHNVELSDDEDPEWVESFTLEVGGFDIRNWARPNTYHWYTKPLSPPLTPPHMAFPRPILPEPAPHKLPAPYDPGYYGHVSPPQQMISPPMTSPPRLVIPKQGRPVKSATSTPSSSRRRSRLLKAPHINKEYTEEQNFWIIYQTVDRKQPWSAIEKDFRRQFGIDVKRTDGGLQSTYYRWNAECPVIDHDGQLQYGTGPGFNKWNVKTHQAKVRQRGEVSLIDRYATEIVAARFNWILPSDMMKARKLGESFLYSPFNGVSLVQLHLPFLLSTDLYRLLI